jgi:hypothetical protein
VNLRFAVSKNFGINECSYALGEELFKFLSFDINDVYSIYIEIADALMDYYFGSKKKTLYEEKLAELCGELEKRSVYLHWYTVDLIASMTELLMGRKYALESYVVGNTLFVHDMLARSGILMADDSLKPYFDIDFLEKYQFRKLTGEDLNAAKAWGAERELARVKSYGSRKISVSKPVMHKSIGLAVLYIAEDLKLKRKMFLGDIEAITENNETLDGLSLTQKLYMLDIRRVKNGENGIYNSNLWSTSFQPCPRTPYDHMDFDEEHEKNIDDKEIIDYLLKNNIEIKQIHEIERTERLIIFELITLLTSGAIIKKCKFCGNYFVPQGRSERRKQALLYDWLSAAS